MAYLRSRAHIVLRDLLVELRKATKLNQKQFAARVGWGTNTVERIESGNKIPSALEARDWAIACGITPYALTWRLEARMKRQP